MVSSFAAIRSSVHRAMEERVSSEEGEEGFYDPRHPGLNSVVNVNPRDCRDETMIDVDLSTSHVRSLERWKGG